MDSRGGGYCRTSGAYQDFDGTRVGAVDAGRRGPVDRGDSTGAKIAPRTAPAAPRVTGGAAAKAASRMAIPIAVRRFVLVGAAAIRRCQGVGTGRASPWSGHSSRKRGIRR